MAAFDHTVSTVADLRSLYRQPSKLVQAKKVGQLDEPTQRFLRATPFVLLATSDDDGRCDVSPRGGPPGFVKVLDENRIAIPDLNGNNLLDTLQNVITNAHVGLLAMIPGREETLRLDGAAWITVDPDVLRLWDGELRTPKAAIGIAVDAAFIHCAKAFRRGQVWDVESWQTFTDVPDGCELLVSNLGMESSSAEQFRASLDAGYEQQLAEDRPAQL